MSPSKVGTSSPSPTHGLLQEAPTTPMMVATIVIDDLSPGSYFDFKVSCRNSAGVSDFSPSSFRTKTPSAQVPGVVNSVWCTEVSPTSMVVNWDEPCNNGAKILGYVIQEWSRDYDDVPLDRESSDDYECSGNITKKRMDAMDSTVSYRFRVQSRNEIGYSDWSVFSERIESCKNDKNRAMGIDRGERGQNAMDLLGKLNMAGTSGGVNSDDEFEEDGAEGANVVEEEKKR